MRLIDGANAQTSANLTSSSANLIENRAGSSHGTIEEALFRGSLGEIAGLMISNVMLHHSVPHLVIRQHPHRRLKNASARRLLPLVGDELTAASEALALGNPISQTRPLGATSSGSSNLQFFERESAMARNRVQF